MLRLLGWMLITSIAGTAAQAASADAYEFNVRWSVSGEGGFSAPNALYAPGAARPTGIVLTERDRGVALFSLDGERVWEFPMTPPVSAPVAVADVTGDGLENIVAADGKGALVCLDADGRPVWTAQLPEGVAAESTPAIVDLDGDGHPEILVGDSGGNLSCLDRAGNLRWRFTGGGRMGPVLTADLYDTPGMEIIVTSLDRHIYALTAEGEWLWDIYRPDDLFPNSTPVLADVDGDGVPEVYVGGGLHHFYRIDPGAGMLAHEENVYLHVNSAINAADLNGDGRDAVVFGNKGGAVWCYGDGGFEWTLELPTSSVYAAPLFLRAGHGSNMYIVLQSVHRDLNLLDAEGNVLATAELPYPSSFASLTGDLAGTGTWSFVSVSDGGFAGVGGLMMVDLNLPYNDDPRNTRAFAGNRARSGVVAQNRSYEPLPVPRAVPLTSARALTPLAEPALFGGTSEWRFDVAHPEAGRLAVILAVVSPDGVVHRTIRHVTGSSGRVSVPVHVNAPGAYRIHEQVFEPDQRRRLHHREYTLNYDGASSDRRYLVSNVFEPAENHIESWQDSNPAGASGARRELRALRGALELLLEIPAADDGAASADATAEMAALRKRAERLGAFIAAARTHAPSGSFYAWPFNPWAHFDPVETLPQPDAAPDPVLRADLCKGEYQSLALHLTNVRGRALNVRVHNTASDVEAPAIELRRSVVVPALRRDEIADALAPLDEAGLVHLAPFESEQLWLTVSAAGVAPGTYELELRLKSVEPDPTEVTVPVQVTVHGLALPRPRPLRFCLWAYDGSDLGTDIPHVLRDLVDHGVTVFFGQAPRAECNAQGELAGGLDFTEHDESVKRLAPHGFLLFAGPQHRLTGQPQFSAPWRKAFTAYMQQWAAHMQSLGIGFDQWAVYAYDEPSTPFNEHTRRLAEVSRLVREADPRILNYANPTSGTTMETVRMFTGLVDIWCPSSELLERLGSELVPEAHRVGKEVWFYDAAGGAKTLSTLGIYRWRFWFAWNQGMTGAGWWTYAHHGGADRWDGPNVTGDFFATVYEDTGGMVIGSKRWEAAREGVQDYEYLYLLRDAIERAEARGVDGPRLDAARALLDELPAQTEGALLRAGRRLPLTPDSVPLYDAVHREIQAARAQIRGACIALNAGP